MTRTVLGLWLVVGLLAVGASGCGDPATDDDRGYTKAPLEEPGVLIEGESASPMDALGEPDLLNNRAVDRPGS